MNPPAPFSHPFFTLLPQNPNLNPNPNFFQSFPQNPAPPFQATISTVPPTTTDLSTTLQTLKGLIHLSETTINSLSSPLLHSTSLNDAVLCPCPFNPHHRMPPESLFVHCLRCPSSNSPVDPSLLDSLQYPKTLRSEAELREQNRFVQTLRDPATELCFSLDDYVDFTSNFFYRDCPGAVCSLDQDGVGTSRTFTLPGVLSVECANFIGNGGGELKGIGMDSLRFLPSELWTVRGEIELWSDYPNIYSYGVLQAILCSLIVKESDLLRWVVSNSPRYGIVIDAPMSDHIFLLFRLCLKAVVREAIGFAGLFSRELNGQDVELNVKTMSFKCPILFEVLTWLAAQLSVLYGEMNAKIFSVNLLKQCLLKAMLHLLLFSSEQRVTDDNVKPEGSHEKQAGCEQGRIMGKTIDCRNIFVSQIAAAVAALHERSLLEEKIKWLRFSKPSTSYQRIAEHEYFSKRADEERQGRSNYRPILEHDGLLWQRPQSQGTSIIKTREELLAEERDYKRRRMSYRGKKMKRTTTQVMRDIIEEYMEEIKQAGGIGCFVKGADKGAMFPSEQIFAHDVTTNADELKKSGYHPSEASMGQHHDHSRRSHSDYHFKPTRFGDASPKDYDKEKRNTHGHDGHLENRRTSKDRCGGEYYSRSAEKHRNHGRLHEWNGYQREQDDMKVSRTKHHEISRTSTEFHDSRSYSPTYSVSNSTVRKDSGRSEIKDRRRRNTYRSDRSDSVIRSPFDDRYDPSESRDMYDDDISSGRK
ncbi:U11/U12 small nuclear ribonucleoprotein 48 kDa protein [Malania oleifera]|uniref:U11/U12 small nuclear ribonucleoprotein 48 kDa protein n=1 Tax=Malania oleifera TaxID=397392 RepID=UPI0025AE8C5D|nr:U11/U12 small nuclear ribonucleoprotein 48 kDa protein [Malania oleifera]